MEFHEVASIFPLMADEEFAQQRRKRVSLQERKTKCECCGYPLSQRHHLLQFSEWGETNIVLHLCANCHELWHLIYGAYRQNSHRCKMLVGHFILKRGADDPQIRFLYNKANYAHEPCIEISKQAMAIAEEELRQEKNDQQS